MEQNQKKQDDMPMGLGFGLAMNDEAMNHFSKLSDMEKKQVIELSLIHIFRNL